MCNGGYREHLLTHSRIELLLPHTAFIAAAPGSERGRGVHPDVCVDHSVEDVVKGTDPVLDTALAIVRDLAQPATQ